MKKFRIGDKVFLTNGASYLYPSNGTSATITTQDKHCCSDKYSLIFDNNKGVYYNFKEEDLELDPICRTPLFEALRESDD